MARLMTAALLACPALLACAHPGTSPPAAPLSATPRGEPPPIAVTYRVVRTGEAPASILAGQTDVGVGRGARVSVVAPHDAARQELEIDARRADDGSTLVRLQYEERALDGTEIRWRPEMRLSRGVPARAEVSGSGWGRAIELTMQ